MEPKVAGNIGAVARVMMNFGLSNLRLVRPLADPKSRECLERAMTAGRIVKGAKIFDSTKEAVADCKRVIGTSARRRRSRINWILPKDFTVKLPPPPGPLPRGEGGRGRVALVFGPEERGLSNADLLICDCVVSIPMAQKFPSLNLSHAVTVVLYELFVGRGGSPFGDFARTTPTREIASSAQKEAFYDHLQEALLAVDFLNPNSPHIAMQEIRNIFARAELDAREVNILRGLCRKILNK